MASLLNMSGAGLLYKAPDENSYIQDGLIFQLDGIAKGNSADTSTWVDLKGGLVFTQNGVVESLANGWKFDGTCIFYNSTILSYSTDNTIEACVKLDSGSGNGIFHSSGNSTGKPVLYVWGSNLVFMQRQKYATGNLGTRVKNGNPISLSLNQDRCYGNKTSYALSSGTNYYTDAGETEVGRYKNSYMKGTVYAIRLYNRRLTAEEQLHNIKVDIARFNISI